jgi:GPH family glycoside/pentoside/hexuronide:cation symporter
MVTETVAVQREVSESGKLGFGEKLAYGVGNFGEMMIFNPATSFMVFFYTEIAGIAAATVGTILLVSRLMDFFNPVMGLVVDRTNSRFGKGRPWLLWLAVPFGLCAMLLFTVPPLGMTGKIIYAFITYNLALGLIYTAIDIPYSAMLPLVTPDQHQRTQLSLFRMAFSMIGGMVSFAITLPLVKYLGGGAAGWQRSFIIFGAVGTLFLLVCFAGTKERLKPSSDKGAQVPVKVAANSLGQNKYWLMVAAMAFGLFIMIGLYGANIYFCQYFLHNVELFGPMMTVSQVAIVVGMVAVSPLLKNLGKRNAALVGTLIAIIGQAMMFIDPTNFRLIMAGMIVKSLGSAPLVGSMFAMVADTVEYGEWRTGVRTDGLAYGAISLGNKLAVGLGAALLGWILGLSGYVGGAAVQPPSAMFALKLMFLYVPLAVLVVTALILSVYKLDKEYPAIAVELKQRRAAAQ